VNRFFNKPWYSSNRSTIAMDIPLCSWLIFFHKFLNSCLESMRRDTKMTTAWVSDGKTGCDWFANRSRFWATQISCLEQKYTNTPSHFSLFKRGSIRNWDMKEWALTLSISLNSEAVKPAEAVVTSWTTVSLRFPNWEKPISLYFQTPNELKWAIAGSEKYCPLWL